MINNASDFVVYTAIFGGKDELKEPTQIDKNVDYVCFTDDSTIRSDAYRILLQKPQFESPILSAKVFKLLPHLYFPDYSHSLWIDASLTLTTGDIHAWVDSHLARNNFTVFLNTKRPTLLEEAQFLRDSKKVKPEELDRQLAFYAKEGLPLEGDMINGSTILRAHNASDVVRFDELWWEQVRTYTMRDEVSFRYLQWKHGFPYGVYDFPSRYDNPWVRVHEHKAEVGPTEGPSRRNER